MKKHVNEHSLNTHLLQSLFAGVLLLVFSACSEMPKDLGPHASDMSLVGADTINKKDDKARFVVMLEANGKAKDGKVSTYYCTASHITPTILVTAAHCFGERKSSYTLTYTKNSFFSSFTVAVPAKNILIHEGYADDKSNDIALIHVDKGLPNQTILSLPTEAPTENRFEILALGFGITNATLEDEDDSGDGLGTLRGTNLQAYDFAADKKSFRVDMTQGKGINSGDSGGPAILTTSSLTKTNDDGTETPSNPTVIGIAKLAAFHHQKNGKRIFDAYGEYTSLFFFKDWIATGISKLEENR